MSGRTLFVCVGLAGLGLAGACGSDGGQRPIVDGAIDAGGEIDARNGSAPDAATPDALPLSDASRPDANVLDAGCAPGPIESGFRAVACGALAHPRWRHEAALLPDGRVLVVGGWEQGPSPSEYNFLADVEVFDPATETFAVVDQLAHPRVGHRATRLADGRVLVTGGEVQDGGYLTATTEIFDPATDTISPGPTMTLARHDHTATLLADGRVLVTGGETLEDPDPYSEGVAVAEVFDPTTAQFTLVGPMTHERHEHEAARLLDGRVLLTGGADAPSCCDDGIAAAELFDPATSTFAVTDSLVTPRPAHRTTLLADGRVLVTGGSIAHGGADGPTYLYVAELYDPATSMFVATGRMETAPGSSYTATLLSTGRVLVAGGLLGDRAELYDPSTGTFSTIAEHMTAFRSSHTATLLPGGTVLLVGGQSQDTAELYTP